MALTNVINNTGSQLDLAKATQDNYTTLTAIYDALNKPDKKEGLAPIYGRQEVSGLNGFLSMVGASKSAGMADSISWFEEQRLHGGRVAPTASTAITEVGNNTVPASPVAADSLTLTVGAGHLFIEKDVVLVDFSTDGSTRPTRCWVASTTSTQIVVHPYGFWAATQLADAAEGVTKISNEFGQGTNQPTEFLASGATELSNTFYILKTMFSVTGSQMTNIDWVNTGGSALWYHKQEKDFRLRTKDYDEMFAMLGDKMTNTGLQGVADFKQRGSEGVFSAIESRGLNYENYIETMDDLDKVIRQLDKQAGVGEYAFYVNRIQDQLMDNLGGRGNTAVDKLSSGVNEQYNTFGGDKSKALNLGFASYSRSSYTFHKHDYKLLNDPQLLGATGAGYYKGVMIPMMFTNDAQSGEAKPIVQINYKGAEGYSREMEHFRLGGLPMAGYTNGQDAMQFEYRCEKNTTVHGANNCVLFRGGTGA